MGEVLKPRITFQDREDYKTALLNDNSRLVPLMDADLATKWEPVQMEECVKDAIKSVTSSAEDAKKYEHTRNVPITLLTAGSGRGKTRFLEEVRRELLADTNSAAPLPVMITFNGRLDCLLSKAAVEAIVQHDNRKRVATELAMRLWFAAFRPSDEDFGDFCVNLKKRKLWMLGDAEPREILDKVLKEISEAYPNRPIVVRVDESILLAEKYDLTENPWEAFDDLRALSGGTRTYGMAVLHTALRKVIEKTASGRSVIPVVLGTAASKKRCFYGRNKIARSVSWSPCARCSVPCRAPSRWSTRS